MRTSFTPRGALIAIVLSAMAFSCELSSSFLSESERSSLYAVKLSADAVTLENGSFLDAGASISASVSKLTGASDIALLDLDLEGTDVAQRIASPSARDVATAESAESTVAVRTVSEIEGTIPALALPDDLAPGAYRLSLQLSSEDGRVLQRLSLVLFIGLAQARIDSVAVYPPSVEPGQAILLSVTPTAEGDPWIRWSRDGAAFAQGPRSKGYDRVVWTAPRVEGAYALSVEAFPAAPPDGSSFAFASAARQDFKAMVKATADGAIDEFADPLKFLSLLRFDGSFDDSGVRPRDEQPVPFGSPTLEIFPSIPGYLGGFGKLGGFGYLFGEAAGVRIPGLMPPLVEGKSAPFAVVFRLSPSVSSGYLLRFASADDSYLLEFGLEEGKPYASLLAGEASSRSVAEATVPAQPRTIVAYLQPGDESTLVTWNVEGERFDAPPLPALPMPPQGHALLGGPGSLLGVYDAFGLMSPLAPASFRLASARKWKTTLAEAFEDGLIPAQAVTKGDVTVSVGSVVFQGASSLTFGATLSLERPLLIEANMSGDLSALSLSVEGRSGGRLFSVSGEGALCDGKGGSLGSIPAADGKISFLLSSSGGDVLISSPGKRGAFTIKAESLPSPYALSIARADVEGSSAISRVLVRDASATR